MRMMSQAFFKIFVLLLLFTSTSTMVMAQVSNSEQIKKAAEKIESGYKRNNQDTLAKGYYDLGESFYQKGDLLKSEENYKKSKDLYEKSGNADGIAKSSRALAKVQEDLHKDKEAITNYTTARINNIKTGDANNSAFNGNDIARLSKPDSIQLQQKYLQLNIDLGIKNKDTAEIITNYSRMANVNLKNAGTNSAVNSFSKAYQFSAASSPNQALWYNQKIADAYVIDKDFDKAIETKKTILTEGFVENSTKIKANELVSLADIYIQKKSNDSAINLLNESYTLSVKNGHTLEAKRCIEKLDSIYLSNGKKDLSLTLYKNFLTILPEVIAKDSSLLDNKIIEETVGKIQKLETEKALKDDLIKRKNIFNYWLIGSLVILGIFLIGILSILKKLKIKNKKIALQSLRREMNPHFIFNSLNSINQFISNNNELEANQYLTRFSTLMRRVMENSKEDFVLFSKEIELLQNYLELERSRFPDKFNFLINIDDALYAQEELYIPGMLIQPHLENAIWHGLRYIEGQGLLQLNFIKKENTIEILIEDNGIGIAESKRNKTSNQKQHSGRGITNTMERIKILNELYHQNITCVVEDKIAPNNGAIVSIIVPVIKHFEHEN